jgi:16S rRNA (cytosine1402-N4)-methyltransferase
MSSKAYRFSKNINAKPLGSYPEAFLFALDEVQRKVQAPTLHLPIMTREILFFFWEKISSSETSLTYFDGTFGRGGHYSYLRAMFPQMKATVFDQDEDARSYALSAFKKDFDEGLLQFHRQSFHDTSVLETSSLDLMLLDLGVSSPQLDEGGRGFSFLSEGPLDMRMDRSQSLTAKDLLAVLSEEQLNSIFKKYGEIRSPYRVTRALVHDRRTKIFETTRELAGLIERIDGWRIKGFHPATQYFMALRLYLNRELEGLEDSLPRLMSRLKDQGRMQVLTFHSLEDRIVKNLFKTSNMGETLKKVITPSEDEMRENPRSRSAKLRVFTRSEKEFTLGTQSELESKIKT